MTNHINYDIIEVLEGKVMKDRKVYDKTYREKHKEERNKYQKEYYVKNKEERTAYKKEYYQRKKDEINKESKKLNTRVEREKAERLERILKKEGKTVSEFMREAIEEYLQKME